MRAWVGGALDTDLLDDERGVVSHEADQRRAARVLVVRAQEVQAGGRGRAAPMDRRAMLVDGLGHTDPRGVRVYTGCPHDRLHLPVADRTDRPFASPAR